MLSKIPIKLEKISQTVLDKSVLRMGLLSKLESLNLYEQLAETATDEEIKSILLDIAKEEKKHLGEFLLVLLDLDEEQESELEHAREELKLVTGKENI